MSPVTPSFSGDTMDRISALRMASLWERRISSTTDPDIEEHDISPFDLFPKTKPLRQRSVIYKRPRQVSANKPPVPPPLASNPVTMAVEEVQLSEAALEAMSPVSSFISSEPSSPSFVARVPSTEIVRSGKVWDEIRRLRDVVKRFDERLSTLETRNRVLVEEVHRMSQRARPDEEI